MSRRPPLRWFPSPCCRGGSLALVACLALSGCAAPARRDRAPRERAQRDPAARDPAPAPAQAPPPAWSETPQLTPSVTLRLDEVGHVELRGEQVLYLAPALDDERSRFGAGVAVLIEVPKSLPWRDVEPVLAACREAGLVNLHWKLLEDARPAITLRRFPARDTLRAGVAELTLRGEAPAFRWRGAAALLRGDEMGDEPGARLSLTELLVAVRSARARRVSLRPSAEVAFTHVFEALEGLRSTGTLLSLGE